MMFQGYLERGFVAEKGDLETLTELLGTWSAPVYGFCTRDGACVEEPIERSGRGRLDFRRAPDLLVLG